MKNYKIICYTNFGDNMHEFEEGLFGLAIGDALGLPLNGMTRDQLLKNPVTCMINGKHEKGTWSNATALTLAVIASLNKGSLKEEELLDNFVKAQRGEYSINHEELEFGKTTTSALDNYLNGHDSSRCGGIDLNDNGSGAIIRMFPIACLAYMDKLKEEEILDLVRTSVSVTHAHEINILGCYIYTLYLIFLLRGKDKHASLSMIQCCDYSMFKEEYVELYSRILKGSLKEMSIDNIKTNGYIVSSLEASLYVLLNSENYSQAILGAINLGGEVSTVSSLVGCMAGIAYGMDSIPEKWITNLKGKNILQKVTQ